MLGVLAVVGGGCICLGRPPGVRIPAGWDGAGPGEQLLGSDGEESKGAIGHPERAIASLFGISSVVLEPLGV